MSDLINVQKTNIIKINTVNSSHRVSALVPGQLSNEPKLPQYII